MVSEFREWRAPDAAREARYAGIDRRLARLRTVLAVALAALVASVAGGIAMVYYGGAASREGLENIRAEAAEKALVSEALHRAMGYGGAIHNFKNAVLRDAPEYSIAFAARYAEAKAALALYRGLEVDSERLADLTTIEATLDRYAAMRSVIETLRAQGASPREIDRAVRIDDAPAEAALARLQADLLLEIEAGKQRLTEAAAAMERIGWIGIIGVGFITLVATLAIMTAEWMRRIAHRRIISRARLSERLRAQAAALKQASTAKTMFLANASHELRTPLTAIMGFSEIIRDSRLGPGGDTKAYAERAQFIHEAATHLNDVMNDLLDLAKIENDGPAMTIEPVDLDDILLAAKRLTRVRMAESGVQFRIRASNPPAVVLGDPRLIRQIIVNLITNAAKYAGSGATCRIFVAPLGQDCAITVADDGPGMSPDELKQAMEPFGRLSRHADDEGTGLGLPLVDALIRRHGGRLEIDTAPGEGFAVRVVFPAAAVLTP